MPLETPTLSLERLVDRLAALEPAGGPVLSLYLDTRPDEHGRDHFQPFLRKELRARGESFAPDSPERGRYEDDAERIRVWVRDELRRSANGVAVFACGAAGLFEPVQLDVPLEASRLHVGTHPHVYPLVRLLDRYPRYAALITDTNLARLYVFGLGERTGERTVASEKITRTEVGGWSQMRYQRHVDDHYRRHAKEVVQALEETVRAEGIEHVVLAGDEVIVPLLRDQLPEHLAQKVVEVLRLDIRTPEREVLLATLDALQRHGAATEAERVQRLLDEYRAGGLAVLGARATEAALAVGQAHELLLSADPATLRWETEEGAPADAPAADLPGLADRLVRMARQTSAQVTMVEDAALLAAAGGVGATLRYRLPPESGDARRA